MQGASTTNLDNHYLYELLLKPVLEQLKLNNQPSQIFNANESFVCLSAGPSTVLAIVDCRVGTITESIGSLLG